MGSIFSKAMVFLGLVDEEDGAEEPYEGREQSRPPRRRPEPPRRRPAPAWDEPEEEETLPEPRRGPETRRIESLNRVEGRRVEPPAGASRITSYRESSADTSPVRPIRSIDVQADILVVEEFGDAKILADRVRDKVPVVLDLRNTNPDLVRRVVDFSSGLIYALDGSMNKVAEGVVVVLPPRVTLSRDERRRLARLGVYDLPEDD
jgi:cell division inhibitor SepF